MFSFFLDNRRWLSAGLLLTFASSFGQTWFISLFAGFIKAEHGLTDGTWGILYTAATLASAGLLFWRGSWADSVPLVYLAPIVAAFFAVAALGFAFSPAVWLLGLSVFGLRFCGQGMFSHIAMTAMGKWFAKRRGQAVAITSLGYPIAEVTLSFFAVSVIGLIGWQSTWLAIGVLLGLPIALAFWILLSENRSQQGQLLDREMPGLSGRHWRRRDAVRHWLLPALLPVLLTPGFIGTVIFFHQVHVSNEKGWSLVEMIPGYTFYAVFGVAFSFVSGWASDRFGAHRLLPFLLVPMGLGIALVGPAQYVWGWYAALALIGISQGVANTLSGALYPHLYGTRHLGAIRSMAITIMVVSTAVGPGVTGLLIDRGITFPEQCIGLGFWCLILSIACVGISRRVTREMDLKQAR